MDRLFEHMTPAIVAGLVGCFIGMWIASRRLIRQQNQTSAELLWAEMRMDMNLEGFRPAAKTSDVPDPGSSLVEVDDRLVVLIHAAGHWYALDDVCTHDGGPLSEGPLDAKAGTISCPRHGAKFDIKSGAALTMPATKPTVVHEVKVEGDQVLVRLAD